MIIYAISTGSFNVVLNRGFFNRNGLLHRFLRFKLLRIQSWIHPVGSQKVTKYLSFVRSLDIKNIFYLHKPSRFFPLSPVLGSSGPRKACVNLNVVPPSYLRTTFFLFTQPCAPLRSLWLRKLHLSWVTLRVTCLLRLFLI